MRKFQVVRFYSSGDFDFREGSLTETEAQSICRRTVPGNWVDMFTSQKKQPRKFRHTFVTHCFASVKSGRMSDLRVPPTSYLEPCEVLSRKGTTI